MKKDHSKPGLVITTDGHVKVTRVDTRKSLRDLYLEIGHTSVVQMVDVPNSRFKIWMDEEGKLKGLPVNRIATQLWGNDNDVIVGTVVVLT